jgi:hypothetical protein
MYMGLSHDRDLSLVCLLSNCIRGTSGRRLSDFFLEEVIQSSFPSLLVARNHQNRCYASAWGRCADYHCREGSLMLRLVLEFFFVAQACGSARPPTYLILQIVCRAP